MMTLTTERKDLVLRICKALGGAITLDVLYAAMPSVQESAIRRLIAAMSAAGALHPTRLFGTHNKLWLDADGRRWFLRRDADGLWCTHVVPGRTFPHDRLAARLVGGFGHRHGMQFDRELPVYPCERKPDGIAWVGEHHALVPEVERMRGRNTNVWDDERRNGVIKPGLLSGMVAIMRSQQRREPDESVRESLVCLPARFIPKLEARLASRVEQLGPSQCGWWSVPMEDPDADPVWHPVRGGQRPDMPGLRAIRARLRPTRSPSPPPPRWSMPPELEAIFERALKGNKS